MFSQSSSYLRWHGLLIAILSSLWVSGIITGLRHLGFLEEIELFAYDRFIEMRAKKGPDHRILLVEVDDPTIKKLNTDKVSDRYLAEALKKLDKHQPRVIGIDIIRDVPIGEGREELINYANQKYEPLEGKIKPIIFACALPSEQNLEGLDPPPIIDRDSAVGFVNLETDETSILGKDIIVRRFPLSSIPAPNNKSANNTSEVVKVKENGCYVPFSFGFLIASSYLQIKLEQTDNQLFKFNSIVFTPPTKRAGSYQNLNADTYQEFLDYWYRDPVDRISLSEVLEGRVDPQRVKDKIILIGYTTNDDIHQTPYGTQPGVLIHGWVVSQILGNVLDGRPQIWYFSELIEWLWIGSWGMIGGIISWKFRSGWLLYLSEGAALGVIFGTSFILFTYQGWVPLIPPVLTLVGAVVTVKGILFFLSQIETLMLFGKSQNRVQPVDSTSILDPNKTTEEPIIELNNKLIYSTEPNKTTIEPPDIGTSNSNENVVEPKIKPKKEYVRLDPLEGKMIDESNRYLIKKQLGMGGMSRVYLASDNKLPGKEVAIKIMVNYSSMDNQSLIKRFEREIKVISRLSSPNIVQIVDFGIVNKGMPFEGSPFYAMEYLVGKTLKQRIEKGGALSLNEAIPIMLQICAALTEAHNNNIIHRDLKPENIFLVSRGSLGEQVKILDFGIAKIIEPNNPQQTEVTMDGGFIGTYQYASPEQCSGNYEIDQRSDIFSLGLIFYEILSGTNPYNIDSAKTTGVNWAVNHITRPPQSLKNQKRCQKLPVKLEALVMKCLEKNPSERFANINQIEKSIQEIIS